MASGSIHTPIAHTTGTHILYLIRHLFRCSIPMPHHTPYRTMNRMSEQKIIFSNRFPYANIPFPSIWPAISRRFFFSSFTLSRFSSWSTFFTQFSITSKVCRLYANIHIECDGDGKTGIVHIQIFMLIMDSVFDVLPVR